MKYFITLGLLIAGISNANASQINRVCFSKAETAVKRQAAPGYYDENGIQGPIVI